MCKEIFKIIYNSFSYCGMKRVTAILNKIAFILKQWDHLLKYIKVCPKCQLVKAEYYCAFKELHLIKHLKQLFNVLYIDFIVGLLLSNNFNFILTVMDKFLKVIKLVTGKKMWNTIKWVN